MKHIQSIARIGLPWFVIVTLVYTYIYVNESVFTSLTFISYFLLSILFSRLLYPEVLLKESTLSITSIIKFSNTTLALAMFLMISIYAWMMSDISYLEIFVRVVATTLQFIFINYIAVLLLLVIPRQNIVLALASILLFTSLLKDVGENYLLINIFAGFFYIPVILLQKEYFFIASATALIQIFVLFLMKQLAIWKIEGRFELKH